MGDLDVETSKNFCDSLGKSFGVGQDNKSTLVGMIQFLLSIQLAAIVNEVNRAVISREGFRYSLSFPCDFLSGGMFFARSIWVRTTECLCWGWRCDLKSHHGNGTGNGRC